jgi:glycosyltransferase involved in cell wall biosynthesis
VAITTYNLEKWLPRALDSALMQRRDFPIEIVIGDDASTDGTLCIAQAYRDKHPDIIRVVERANNVGVQRNTYETLGACRGKYTACLDGDDYWTDPDKLRVQVEVLEPNPTLQRRKALYQLLDFVLLSRASQSDDQMIHRAFVRWIGLKRRTQVIYVYRHQPLP